MWPALALAISLTSDLPSRLSWYCSRCDMPLASIVATNSTLCNNQVPCTGVYTQVGTVERSNVPLSKMVGVMGNVAWATCASERTRKLQGHKLLCGCATGLSYCNHTTHRGVLASTIIG